VFTSELRGSLGIVDRNRRQPARLNEAALAAHDRDRPGVGQALRLLEHGEANALVAAKRARPCQALGELAALLASAQRRGWALKRSSGSGGSGRPAAAWPRSRTD